MAGFGQALATASCYRIVPGGSVVDSIVDVRSLGFAKPLGDLSSRTLLFIRVLSDGTARCAQWVSLRTWHSTVGDRVGHVRFEHDDGLVAACRTSKSLETSQVLHGRR